MMQLLHALKRLVLWTGGVGVVLFLLTKPACAQVASTFLPLSQIDIKVEKPIFTPSGKSLVYLGHRLTYPAKDQCQLTAYFHCLDRTDDSVSLKLRLESLVVGAVVREQQEDCSSWQIGEIIEVNWYLDLDRFPLGTYRLFVDYLNQSEFLETVSVYDGAFQEILKPWRFIFFNEVKGLDDALSQSQNVGFLQPDVILLACQEAPWPDHKVGVVYQQKVVPDKQYRLQMEINDSYGSSGMEGNIEQRVYLNDQVVFRHDIGGVGPDGRTYGWYKIDVPIETSQEYIDVKIEVAPLKPLGPWGWGAASRTQIRHVTIVAD